MNKISVSEFKAVCLRILREVHATGQEVMITKDGEDLALVTPPRKKSSSKKAFGALKHRTKIDVDLSTPNLTDEWAALKRN